MPLQGDFARDISVLIYLNLSVVFSVYHALYLEHLAYSDFLGKIADLFSIEATQIREVFTQGPSGKPNVFTIAVLVRVSRPPCMEVAYTRGRLTRANTVSDLCIF